MPSSSASFCNSRFQRRTREPLLPPPSAVMKQTPCQRITNAAHVPPPAANSLHGECRCIVVDPDIHPARVGGKIINSIGHGAAKFRDQKVVHTHFFWR